MTKVLSGVDDDAQRIRSRVEIDAERCAYQCDVEAVNESRLCVRRINGIDAALVADCIKQPVLDPEIDADDLGVGIGIR